MGTPSKIDRLIEMGLSRYSAGDLEGALVMWEEALAIDPGNKQVSSYVDYVRLHFELLGKGPEVAAGEHAPLPIQEEPEYQIELSADALQQPDSQPVLANEQGDGWFDDESAVRELDRAATLHDELELELDTPLELEAELPPPELNFEPATREYYGTPTAPAMVAEASDFADVGTEGGTREYARAVGGKVDVAGSSNESGGLDLRATANDSGGLDPRATANDNGGLDARGAANDSGALDARATTNDSGSLDARTTANDSGALAARDPSNDSGSLDFSSTGTDSGTREFRSVRGAGSTDFTGDEYTGGFNSEGTLGFSSQETGIRKRDFGFVQPAVPVRETRDVAGSVPAVDSASITDGGQTTERPSMRSAPTTSDATADDADEEDLLATLPNPRRQNISDLPTQDVPVMPVMPSSKAITKEMPDGARRPARRDTAGHSQAEVLLPNAPTKDYQTPRVDITAPTRDLGLRPLPLPQRQQHDDDEIVTKQSDVRALRAAVARQDGEMQPDPEGTRDDYALPFDPIDARAAEILEEVDANAPSDESHDDQTRRRIAALLERAVQWNAIGETEKAVAAVDLAMNEDPNSALGQKLITRNRDTIMNVFQGFLGDLERMPQLARPLHQLQDAAISSRAAFLLSRIDGMLTIDELLDVSGMPRVEAFRHLCQLYLRGILR